MAPAILSKNWTHYSITKFNWQANFLEHTVNHQPCSSRSKAICVVCFNLSSVLCISSVSGLLYAYECTSAARKQTSPRCVKYELLIQPMETALKDYCKVRPNRIILFLVTRPTLRRLRKVSRPTCFGIFQLYYPHCELSSIL